MKHTHTKGTVLVACLLFVALFGLPSAAEAQTYSSLFSLRPVALVGSTAILRTPTMAALVPPPPQPSTATNPSDDTSMRMVDLDVRLRGTFGALPTGEVIIRRDGREVASADLGRSFEVAAVDDLEVVVVATSLVDRPTIVVSGVDLSNVDGSMTLPVDVATGLVRAQAHLSGRRVSGVVRFYRVDDVTGVVDNTPSGSISANGRSREISAGRYVARLQISGRTLSRQIEIVPGSSRLVQLFG